MRRRLIIPLILVAFIVLTGAAIASSTTRDQRAAKDRKEAFDKAPKQKMGDEVIVLGVWRNCKFHLVRVKAERESAVLPNGEVVESAKVTENTKDAMAAQLPERDPKCDNVEPSPEQIEANRSAIDAETARLNPGRPRGPRN